MFEFRDSARRMCVRVCLIVALAAALAGPSSVLAQQSQPASGGGADAASKPQDAAPSAKPAEKAAPPPPLPAEVTEPVTKLARSIETAEKSIQQLKELEGELARLRSEVEGIIYESTSTAEALRPQLTEVKSQIEKLGPPPKPGEPPESPTVVAERERLNALAGGLGDAIKTAELAWVRAKQLIDRITVMRYQMFTKNLFERRDSPLLPGVWRDVSERLATVYSRFKYYGNDWITWASRHKSGVTALFGGALLGYILLKLLIGRFVARATVRREKPPSFFERAAKDAWIVPLRLLPLSLTAIAIYAGLDAFDLLFHPWGAVAMAALKGLLIYAAASALMNTVLAPSNPGWRLVPVADGTARRMTTVADTFVAFFVLDAVTIELLRAIYSPLAITVVWTFLISVANAGLLIGLLLTRFEPLIGPDRPVNGHEYVPGIVTRNTPLTVKIPLWLIALTILGSSAIGYVALARFVAQQLVLTGIVLIVAGLLYLAIRAAARGRGDGTSPIGRWMGSRFGLDDARQRQIARLVELTGTLLVALLALPALLVQWGFSNDDVRDWLKALLFGFEVGQFRISLVRILIGIFLFTALLFTTRLVQRWLRENVLVQPRMDAGIANSIDTAVGYTGSGLALLLAASYAGFDVTSLTILASAFAVGIGFGLQSIVNNFVSGLILLVERPIKVGDWIVLGSEQGNVRRISVRSTEIETFDRASLIVPNSELVGGRVLNWTHRNQMGRSIVKITLDSYVDPARAIEVLKACADAHPEVLKKPEPSVSFDSFSSTTLDFTIRVTLADVYRGGKVTTDLRVAILRILKEEGLIQIPAPPAVAAAPDAAITKPA